MSTKQLHEEEEDDLTFEIIAQKFDKSLSQAAKEFNMCTSTLKRKCRHVNIMQWPFRKVKIYG